jgi:glutathione S-transferase|tara:strand:- start:244 stop:930 length:687 start_codon:yes stop_codon:yes gene_type:complete
MMPASNHDMTTLPILYSFRRCPYAMRARMAILGSGRPVELRNILLKDKPPEMLTASPKGTVPVLVLDNGDVLEESIDIMLWALSGHDPDGWLPHDRTASDTAFDLIAENDGHFKTNLDRYKYHVRFPDHPREAYRAEGEAFLSRLEQRLASNRYLLGERQTLADIAIFPFIRQFANVDPDWFANAPYPRVRAWLTDFTNGTAFRDIMKKRPLWTPGTVGELLQKSDAA